MSLLSRSPVTLGRLGIMLVLAMLCGFSPLNGQLLEDDPMALKGIDVEEQLGNSVPLDLTFTSGDGATVRLGEYLQPDRPTVLVLGYYTCPMLCNLVFNGLTGAAGDLAWTPGIEYQILSVSIDPRDTDLIARAKRKNYQAALGKAAMPSQGWDFLTADAVASSALADAIGFRYYYDEEQDQYAHPAVITILSPQGKITRYLYGIEFKSRDLRLALVEATDGKIGNTIDRLILSCYHYDPNAAGYVLFAGGVMRIGGALVLVGILFFLARLWWRERHRALRFAPPGPGMQSTP